MSRLQVIGGFVVRATSTPLAKRKDESKNRRPLYMSPKSINGKVWISVESAFGGGYQKLPEDDPKYKENLLWIDSQRFVELLDWVYNQRT